MPGIDKPHVSWAPDAEMGKTFVGEKIVVVGAGQVGLEAAIDFKRLGKDVCVIELLDNQTATANLFKAAKRVTYEFLDIMEKEGIPIHYNVKLSEIRDDKIICEDTTTGNTTDFACDTVLIAIGMTPLTEKAAEMRHCAPETSVRIVGDAEEVGSIHTAVNSAFRAALNI